MKVKVDKKGGIIISDFSAVQAYKIAVKLEKDGIQFYRDLKKEIKDDEALGDIDFLIREEEQHLSAFEGLLSEEKGISGDDFEEDDVVQYINTHVFDASGEKEEAKAMSHRHTGLEKAMDMEKRSIVFYDGLLAFSKDPQAKKALCRIVEEEEKHLRKFSALLRDKCIRTKKGCLL